MLKSWSIAKSALLISIVAATFTGLQWYDAHSQLIYTLKPLVNLETDSDPDESPIGIMITNNGPGLAIIRSLTYYVDKKPFKNWDDVVQYSKLSDDQSHYLEFDKGDALAVGTIYWPIIEKNHSHKNQREYERFADLLEQHIAVKVEYCSLLGECWAKCSTKNLCD